MKQPSVLIMTLLILGIPSISYAQQCAFSTCITPEIIVAADHGGPPPVEYSPALTHYEFIILERGPYDEPALTNVTVYRQEAEDKLGVLVDYPDAFCTMEGYAYGRFPTEVEREIPAVYEERTVYDPVLGADGEPIFDEDGNPITTPRVIQVLVSPADTVTDTLILEGCAP